MSDTLRWTVLVGLGGSLMIVGFALLPIFPLNLIPILVGGLMVGAAIGEALS